MASVSDIHLFNRRVSTQGLLRDLDAAFPRGEETKALDLILLPGDLFDRLVYFNNVDTQMFMLWAGRFFRMCEEYDIIIRVSRGTISHDRDQGMSLNTVHMLTESGCDFRYIDTLYIEHIDKLDIDILYIPDEWRHDTDETWRDVQMLLASKGLTKVDIALTHGFFDHQAPNFPWVPKHVNARYESIVRKYICNGHDHDSQVFGRIIVQGSFGRLGYGEEGPKGHYRIECFDRDDDKDDTIRFVENMGATIFNTYHLHGLAEADVDTTLDAINCLPAGSHVRVYIGRTDENYAKVQFKAKSTTNIHWDVKQPKVKDTTKKDQAVIKRPKVSTVVISPTSIETLVGTRLSHKDHDEADVQEHLKLLKEVL